ncbi:IS110 family transposase [Mesorhizobium sp. AaZ16]|uniref:IS110 family transposase n=1 Tax=Mesorhizobium sp. AaZ16 TaxID=3402289 RepID=UPI00374E9645
MLMVLEGQSHFLPCGVPYWGFETLNNGGSATVPYDYHIGVDYHKSYSHLVVQDGTGRTLRSGRVKNDRHSIAAFLDRYRDNSHAVVEATRNWMVIYDWLAHPLKVKAIADAKIKTDKIDATVLAHLLRADLVPEAWAPSEQARELRLALRERMFYVRLRTMVKNRVVTVFDRYPEQTVRLKKLADLFGKTGRKQLAELPVSPIDRIQIDRSLAFVDDINARIKQSEATIRALTRENTNVKLLKTIPGIGEFFARLIDAEIDDIRRFRSAKKLAAYAGLVPSTYASGGKTYHGKIIKQGNKWLRWAFVEAIGPAVATDPQLREQYERLKPHGTNKARVAIARKLLTIAFQLLREQRPYEQRGHNGQGCASTISRLS